MPTLVKFGEGAVGDPQQDRAQCASTAAALLYGISPPLALSPVGHSRLAPRMQLVAPGTNEKVPGAHCRQALLEPLPALGLYAPAGQLTQNPAPARLYFPA